MVKNTFGFMVGSVLVVLFFINTLFWACLLNFLAIFKYLIPTRGWKDFWHRPMVFMAAAWVEVNSILIKLTQPIEWEVDLPSDLHMKEWYLLIANHQSWVDIVVLQHLFRRKIPFLKFFLKKQLLWVPVLGLAWLALEMPFMKRYSKKELIKNKKLRRKDLETTKKACESVKAYPSTLMNFVEGTRFTADKHDRMKSSYTNLLPPKVAGIASVVSEMGDKLAGIVDVTIIYPEHKIKLWDLFSRNIPRIVVKARLLQVPEFFIGKNYSSDLEFKQASRDWINKIWREKDAEISLCLGSKVAA